MIIVTIMGILSTLAVESYRAQVARAKTAEPRAALGAIRRGVSIAANQDWMAYAILKPGEASSMQGSTGTKTTGGGDESGGGGKGKGKGNGGGNGGGATVTHDGSVQLCGSAQPVPSEFSFVQRKRYQASASEWQQGNQFTGWPCLGFKMMGPQYYQYGYDVGGPKVQVKLPGGGSPPGLDRNFTYTAWARGDLDGDGRQSWFVTEGAMIENEVVQSTGIGIIDETE